MPAALIGWRSPSGDTRRLESCLLGAPRARLATEELRVALDVRPMFGGHVTVEIDRCDGAFGNARTEVDALVGVDEHLDAREVYW